MELFSKDTPQASLRCNPAVAQRQARVRAQEEASPRRAAQRNASALRAADRAEAQMKARRSS